MNKEFNELTRKEVFYYGELLLKEITKKYTYLINDSDWIWELQENLELFNKVLILGNKIEEKESKEENESK